MELYNKETKLWENYMIKDNIIINKPYTKKTLF